MADLIDRAALLDAIRNDIAPFNCAMVFRHIHNAPAVEPVWHGRWLWADDGYLRCSNCHQKAPQFEYEAALESYATKYCPHCGAEMEKAK